MGSLRRLLTFLAPYRLIVAGEALLVLVVTGLNLAPPALLRWAIDSGLTAGEYRLVVLGASAILGVTVLRGLMSFVQRYAMQYVSQRVIFDLRNKLYEHLEGLSFRFYDRAQTGQLMSRVTADVELLNRFVGFGSIRMLESSIMFLGVFGIMLSMNWQLTLVALATAPFMAVIISRFNRTVRPLFREVQQQLATLTSVLQESVAGIRVVKAFGRERHELARFDVENRGYQTINLVTIRLTAFFMPLMGFLSGLGAAFILWYGGRQIINGQLTVGELVAFNGYLLMFLGPIRFLGFLVNLYARAGAAADRIFELLDTPADVSDAPDAYELTEVAGEVEFDHVDFSYDERSPVLTDITLRARPGERIAVVGGTGSGKTTLVYLVPRFYDVDRGAVRIDGHDVREVKVESLRRHIGVVMQETFLFNATLKENITYGRPDATQEEIEEAARAANIHDFIVSLPEGYDTVAGERGVGLSGGQKQRVAIARALLLDAPILILDESTSSVDVQTERLIQEALDRVMEGRTSFIIAQRLSTLRTADRIVVLDRGRVVQKGTHEELLRVPGAYQRIYELQLEETSRTGTVGG